MRTKVAALGAIIGLSSGLIVGAAYRRETCAAWGMPSAPHEFVQWTVPHGHACFEPTADGGALDRKKDN